MRRSHARPAVNSSSENSTDDMDPVKLPIRPTTRSNLFSRNPKPSSCSSSARSTSLILLSAAAAISLVFYLLSSSSKSPRNPNRYGIVIDGGSTGSRVHVFGYRSDAVSSSTAIFDFGKEDGLSSLRVNPGLSSFAEDPEAASASLKELVKFAKGKVPREEWGRTEVRLMATAGLRMLDSDVQIRILDSCRKVLRSSGFKFRDEWASVITGFDEGLYAWVVANHALGTLGGDPLKTIGIIELGGASAQVTFVSSDPMPPQFSRPIKVGNVTYNLYSHSFLHYGQNVAYESLKDTLALGDFSLVSEALQKRMAIDPCTPKGYLYESESPKLSPSFLGERNRYLSSLQSGGNFSECRLAANMMLQKGKENCSHQPCSIGSTFTPKLRGMFLATENFFHTSKFFGLGPRVYLSNLITAGEQFCGEDWSTLKKRYKSFDEEALLQFCFSSAYSVALLHDNFGIALDDERIRVANQIGSIPLDWALGAFIFQSTSELDLRHADWISAIIRDGSPTPLTVIFIFSILLFTVWSLSKWRKPQLKTIYDLEKGRYIVTRINRS